MSDPASIRDMRPTVIVDTREQDPLPITNLPTIRQGLTTGDYSAVGLETILSVERKTVDDFVNCCMGDNRDRFERELHRMRGFRFRRLLIIGSRAFIEQGLYKSEIKPKSVLSTLGAFEVRYEVPVVFAATPEAGARLVESWVWWQAREVMLAVNALTGQVKQES